MLLFIKFYDFSVSLFLSIRPSSRLPTPLFVLRFWLDLKGLKMTNNYETSD